MERDTLTAMPGLQLGKADGLAFLQIVDSPERLVQKRQVDVLNFPPVVMIQPVSADERRATLTVPSDDLLGTLGSDFLDQLSELCARSGQGDDFRGCHRHDKVSSSCILMASGARSVESQWYRQAAGSDFSK